VGRLGRFPGRGFDIVSAISAEESENEENDPIGSSRIFPAYCIQHPHPGGQQQGVLRLQLQ
jgi:hypothetical protein